MNQMLNPGAAAITMSSREIAELVEKRHDNVKRTIETLVERGVIASPQIEDVQEIGGNNRPYTTQAYRIGKRDSYVIVAQLSPEFTARLVDRWQELESKSTAGLETIESLLASPDKMLTLVTGYAAQVVELGKQVAGMQGEVQALNRIAKAEGSLCITDAAKALQVRPNQLFDYLRSHAWIYRRVGTHHDVGYQSKVAQGLLEHKVTIVARPDGSEKITEQVRVTPKGLAKLAEALGTTVGT